MANRHAASFADAVNFEPTLPSGPLDFVGSHRHPSAAAPTNVAPPTEVETFVAQFNMSDDFDAERYAKLRTEIMNHEKFQMERQVSFSRDGDYVILLEWMIEKPAKARGLVPIEGSSLQPPPEEAMEALKDKVHALRASAESEEEE